MAKKKGNKLIYILGGVVLILVIGAYLRSKANKDGNLTKIYTEKLEKRTIVETVSASGRVFPEEELGISSDVSGEIVELYVEEGDTVKAGQLLAKIDPEIYKSVVARAQAATNSSKANLADSKAQIAQFRASVKQAEAQKAQIEAQIESSRATYNRNVKLHKDGVISDADLEASQSALRALEANLASANASIESANASIESGKQRAEASRFNVLSTAASAKEAKDNLKRTTLTAPVDGVISKLNSKKGERVVGTSQMAGTEIMRIANMSAMEVQVDVSENDVLRVKVGDKAGVEVDAYLDRIFDGTVTQVSNSANNTTLGASLNTDQVTNFTVKIRLDPASYKDVAAKTKGYPFRPGMSASVEIVTDEKKDVLAAPIAAVTTRGKEDSSEEDEKVDVVVFVVSDNLARTKTVTTGIQDDKYIEILDGVTTGEVIATGPYTEVARNLVDSTGVTVKDKKEFNKKKRG